jgi:hypothetical protein
MNQPLLLTVNRQDSGFLFRLTLSTVAPGLIAGALRFASLALHVISHKGERRRRCVSARKVSYSTAVRKHTLKSSGASSPFLTGRTRSTQQAWMNSRNLSTIATGFPVVNTFAHRVVAQSEFVSRAFSYPGSPVPKLRAQQRSLGPLEKTRAFDMTPQRLRKNSNRASHIARRLSCIPQTKARWFRFRKWSRKPSRCTC